MRIKFLELPEATRKNIFEQIAVKTSMKPFAVEKDWWVSRTLEIIFSMDVAHHLVFKGGTSLSKAWRLIERFSEDVDLAIDKEIFMAQDTVWSRSKLTKLRKEAGAYTTGRFFEDLQIEFAKRGFNNLDFKVIDAKDSDQDPRIIEIYYPHLTPIVSDYIKPRIQLELGCRSLKEPFSYQEFGSLVDEYYKDREFVEPFFKVPSVNPERTFLEKLFLLHEEFHKPKEKIRIDRLSRHLYDIYRLTKEGVAVKAIQDKSLYETIIKHRYTFSRISQIDYNLLSPKTIDPTPIQQVIDDWKEDYIAMQTEMIYEENSPTFEDLISNLDDLKKQLKSLKWDFELRFPR